MSAQDLQAALTSKGTTYRTEIEKRRYKVVNVVPCLQLLRIEEEGGFVGRIASSGIILSPGPALLPAQQRKVTAYVAQVTRLKRRLDWRLAKLTNRPIAQMEPRLKQILRLGMNLAGSSL